jgi:sulfonate transport system substrate-binding protein
MKTAGSFLVRWVHSLALAGLVLSLAVCVSCKASQTVRIGYQKFGVLIILKEKGTLEKALEASNVKVQWSEFSSGVPMMEAFHAGSIDFGISGEAPPVFAEANGASIVYVGAEPAAPHGEAILVRKDSPLQRVSDLRGKKIALNRGSNVHYFLASALKATGVGYDGVVLVFLPPSDARAAFESGAVDAWAIWDPYLASALHSTDARILQDAEGFASNVPYYISTRAYASEHPEIVRAVEDQIRLIDSYVTANPQEAAAFLAPKVGMPTEAIEDSLRRNPFAIRSVGPELIANQQHVADTFLSLGLIPNPIRIADATLPISQ